MVTLRSRDYGALWYRPRSRVKQIKRQAERYLEMVIENVIITGTQSPRR